MRDLEQGQSYTFSATAMNFYGTSDATNSVFVIAGMFNVVGVKLCRQ